MKSEETDAELNGEDDDEEEVADENDQQEDSAAAADAADIGDHNEYGGDGDVDENEDDVGGGGNADKNEDDGNNASVTGDDGGASAAAIVNDIDMTDIMVIDEYDSTKPETKKSSGTSAATTATNVAVTKPLDDRDKRQLEKRYQLADNPHIICHPSRTAKSGKFSCNIMSLSILLDYRPEDTKEHSFEVSLFAELFNEMLMRDFGFNIYKAMYAMPEKSAKEEAAEEKASAAAAASDDKEKRDVVAAKDDGKSDAAADDAVDKDRSNDSCDRRSTKESTATKSTDRKRRRDDETDDESSIRSGDPKRKTTTDGKSSSSTNPVPRNFYTFDPELLLSFVYFDTTHCGYIFEKDIEELFYTLGLNLSRSQTRRVVARAVTRDSLFYRKLTDKSREVKVEDEGETTATIAENANALTDSSVVVATATVDDIARGNKSFLPIFRLASGSSNVAALQSAAKMEEDCSSSETTTENGTNAQTGMILLFMVSSTFVFYSFPINRYCSVQGQFC